MTVSMQKRRGRVRRRGPEAARQEKGNKNQERGTMLKYLDVRPKSYVKTVAALDSKEGNAAREQWKISKLPSGRGLAWGKGEDEEKHPRQTRIMKQKK